MEVTLRGTMVLQSSLQPESEFDAANYDSLLDKLKSSLRCSKQTGPPVNSKLAAPQDSLVEALSTIICTSNVLLEHREKRTTTQYKELINPLSDAVALLGMSTLNCLLKDGRQ